MILHMRLYIPLANLPVFKIKHNLSLRIFTLFTLAPTTNQNIYLQSQTSKDST